jgi:hypothetical protein
MVAAALNAGVPRAWVLGDKVNGRDKSLPGIGRLSHANGGGSRRGFIRRSMAAPACWREIEAAQGGRSLSPAFAGT